MRAAERNDTGGDTDELLLCVAYTDPEDRKPG